MLPRRTVLAVNEVLLRCYLALNTETNAVSPDKLQRTLKRAFTRNEWDFLCRQKDFMAQASVMKNHNDFEKVVRFGHELILKHETDGMQDR